jgi:hypothetical protein
MSRAWPSWTGRCAMCRRTRPIDLRILLSPSDSSGRTRRATDRRHEWLRDPRDEREAETAGHQSAPELVPSPRSRSRHPDARWEPHSMAMLRLLLGLGGVGVYPTFVHLGGADMVGLTMRSLPAVLGCAIAFGAARRLPRSRLTQGDHAAVMHPGDAAVSVVGTSVRSQSLPRAHAARSRAGAALHPGLLRRGPRRLAAA